MTDPHARIAQLEAQSYRKKPVVISAVQWTGDNLDEVVLFCAGNATYELMARGNAEIVISTLEDGEGTAQHVASRGDWIIRGVQGEYYPCKPDIFAATYEPATLASAPAPDTTAGVMLRPQDLTDEDIEAFGLGKEVMPRDAIRRDQTTPCNTSPGVTAGAVQEADIAKRALAMIRDGYGPQHMSKYARDVAAAALRALAGETE